MSLTSLTVPSILKYLSNNNIMKHESGDLPMRAKKRRLDHLTWEEKLQRKKLKNRVAAQTSRDRKKAKMEEMESALQGLFLRNESLMAECKELRNQNKKLSEENLELRNKQQKATCSVCVQNRSVECDAQQGSAESLPLPKGLATYSAAALKTQTLTALWKVVLACLLYQTSSMNSTGTWTSNPWKNLHKASCKISPQTWKLLLKRQIVKNQMLVDKTTLEKWWGRHQKTWNPVELTI